VTNEHGRTLPISRVTGQDREQPATTGRNASRASDAELLARIRARDESALVELYDRHAGLVLSVAIRVVGDRELAEEILQDTFLRCWQGAATYQIGRGQVIGWLMGITRNRAIDMLRSRQHKSRLREQTSLADPDDFRTHGGHDETETIITRQIVSAAMASLPLTQRHVIELAYYGGMSQAEIARVTGEPLGTVKSRTRIAMDQLRSILRPQFRQDSDTTHE
jgi:RNA polymerase sigma-70 factor, ECF subfamily